MSTESFKDFVFAKSANRDLLLVFAEENVSRAAYRTVKIKTFSIKLP
jgi:hypothetical protein